MRSYKMSSPFGLVGALVACVEIVRTLWDDSLVFISN